jgi:hypothetical protein
VVISLSEGIQFYHIARVVFFVAKMGNPLEKRRSGIKTNEPGEADFSR